MKSFSWFFVVLVFLFAGSLSLVSPKCDQGPPFKPTWPSLDTRPLPAWYDQAKVGIFVHWGVYSVPAFGTEWFWTNWRDAKVPAYVEFMQRNYRPGFTYQEFATDFRAELFNATAWTEMFAESGAKYVVLTSKHHDGYALWPSRYSYSWNSVDVGPHRDIIDELSTEIRRHSGMRFGLYHSLFEWFHPLYLADKSGEFKKNEFVVSKILPELKELVQRYQPEVIWSDGDWEASSLYWNSTEFLAWLYNESPVAATVVSNDRWGNETLCRHGDFYTCSDRFNPGTLQPHKWENAMTIDKLSWGHRASAKLEDYMSTKELIDEIVVTVSCGGNILVNVGPTKYGTIETIFAERLRDMGRWLKINGEAIYGSSPWIYQNDTRTPGVWYTTRSNNIYAMVLEYPKLNGAVNLFGLRGHVAELTTTVTILGSPEPVKVDINTDFVQVVFPDKALLDKDGLANVWTIKFENIHQPRNEISPLIILKS